MSFAVKRLLPAEISGLLPQSIYLIYWIREIHPRDAGDIILAVMRRTDSYKGHVCLREFLFAEKNGRIMSNRELKKLLRKYDISHWINGLFLILSSEEPIIAEYAYEGMMSEMEKNDMKEFNIAIRRMSYASFELLFALLNLISDTCRDPDQGCEKLAPLLCFGKDLKARKSEANEASKLFRYLMKHMSELWGFVEKPNLQLTAFGGNYKGDAQSSASLEQKRIQHLREFYEKMDIQFTSIASELFELHEFEKLAAAVYTKYRSLPGGWLDDLRQLQLQGANLPWFHYDELISSSSTPPLLRGKSFIIGRKNYGEKGKMEAIIDELIDTEIEFYERMRAFQTIYVDALRSIANGSQGLDKRDALGMSEQDIEKYFGGNSKLRNVFQISEKILVRLEVINLIREPTKDGARSRARVVADIMGDFSDDIVRAYSPYGGWYGTTSNQMQKQLRSASSKVKKNPNLLTFGQLYERVAMEDHNLSSVSIEGVLIEPIQRVPRYKILFERLAKAAKEEEVARKVNELLKTISGIADKVDQGVKRGKKLASFFGSEEDEERVRVKRLDDALKVSGML